MSGDPARTPEQMETSRVELRPFRQAGYRLFPLARGQKKPRDIGWQTNEYLFADIGRWLKQGGNVGIALRSCDLVIDIDPRNGGEESFARLCTDVAIDLSLAPTVLSGRGDGGRHLYFTKPTALRVHGKLADYPGIDFKSKGGLVVGPGSTHPDTGGVYAVDDFTLPITDVLAAPRALLEMLRRPVPTIAVDDRVGKISPEQLALLLSALDPADFGRGRYDEWIRLAAACHDATAGAGLTVWLEWCADDPAYGEDAAFDGNVRVWESFTAGRPGGATYRTLLKAVVDAGRPDLVAAIDGDDDALDENFLVYEIETEENPDG